MLSRASTCRTYGSGRSAIRVHLGTHLISGRLHQVLRVGDGCRSGGAPSAAAQPTPAPEHELPRGPCSAHADGTVRLPQRQVAAPATQYDDGTGAPHQPEGRAARAAERRCEDRGPASASPRPGWPRPTSAGRRQALGPRPVSSVDGHDAAVLGRSGRRPSCAGATTCVSSRQPSSSSTGASWLRGCPRERRARRVDGGCAGCRRRPARAGSGLPVRVGVAVHACSGGPGRRSPSCGRASAWTRACLRGAAEPEWTALLYDGIPRSVLRLSMSVRSSSLARTPRPCRSRDFHGTTWLRRGAQPYPAVRAQVFASSTTCPGPLHGRRAGADHGVDLVDEHDGVGMRLELLDDLLQALLEVAAIARARQQRAHVEREDRRAVATRRARRPRRSSWRALRRWRSCRRRDRQHRADCSSSAGRAPDGAPQLSSRPISGSILPACALALRLMHQASRAPPCRSPRARGPRVAAFLARAAHRADLLARTAWRCRARCSSPHHSGSCPAPAGNRRRGFRAPRKWRRARSRRSPPRGRRTARG